MLKVNRKLPLYNVYKYAGDFYMSTQVSSAFVFPVTQYYTLLCKIEVADLSEDWVEVSNDSNSST